jgi:large subunit ribosomal protein L6
MLYLTKIQLKPGVYFIQENNSCYFKGPLGNSLLILINKKIFIKQYDSYLILSTYNKALFYLYLKILRKKMLGTLFGYKKKLRLEGLGYIATLDKTNIVLKLGFSHPIFIKIPETIKIYIKKRKRITLLGSDLNEVTQFAARIRQYKAPEIYKGKGILYFKERIKLKIGKKN